MVQRKSERVSEDTASLGARAQDFGSQDGKSLIKKAHAPKPRASHRLAAKYTEPIKGLAVRKRGHRELRQQGRAGQQMLEAEPGLCRWRCLQSGACVHAQPASAELAVPWARELCS